MLDMLIDAEVLDSHMSGQASRIHSHRIIDGDNFVDCDLCMLPLHWAMAKKGAEHRIIWIGPRGSTYSMPWRSKARDPGPCPSQDGITWLSWNMPSVESAFAHIEGRL